MESYDLFFFSMMEKWKGRKKEEGRPLEEDGRRREERERRREEKKRERKLVEQEEERRSEEEAIGREAKENEIRREDIQSYSLNLRCKQEPQVKYWKDLSVTIYISGQLLGEEDEEMEEMEEKEEVMKTMKDEEDEEGGGLYTEIAETEEDRKAEERFQHIPLPPPLPPRVRPSNSFR